MNASYVLRINNNEYRVVSLDFDHEPRDLEAIPEFKIVLDNRFGSKTQNPDFEIGSIVEIIREDELLFQGVIEPKVFGITSDSSTIAVSGSNKWYKKLENNVCDSYDWVESGLDYGVTINPYEFTNLVFTHPEAELDDFSENPVLDGFRHDEVAEHLIGTKFCYSHGFEDSSPLLASTVVGDTKVLNCYRDSKKSGVYYQTTPRLQLTHNGSELYNVTGTVESISFYNGDPNLGEMGLIESVDVTLYGKLNAGTFTFSICRNGGLSNDPINHPFDKSLRSYIPVTLTPTNVNVPGATTGQTITKFTGSVGISDWGSAGPGRELAYRIVMNAASGNTATPEIEYVKLVAVTESDTGVIKGTVEVYPGESNVPNSEFFEGNFESQTRLKSLSMVRQATIKTFNPSAPVNDDRISTFWDVWPNVDGELNFKKNRGSDIANVYSFENSNLAGIEYEYDGSDIWYTVIAYGSGSGINRNRIVSSEEFDNGGLTIAAVREQYGDAAKIGSFENGNAKSINALYQSARAALKLHSVPFESLKLPNGLIAEVTRYYDVGDLIPITVNDLNINSKLFPIEKLSRKVDARGESIALIIGLPLDIGKAISNVNDGRKDINIVQQAAEAQYSSAASGINFDKNGYGLFTFGISQPEKINRVALKAVTVPFTSSSKSITSFGELSETLVDNEIQTTTLANNAADHLFYPLASSLTAEDSFLSITATVTQTGSSAAWSGTFRMLLVNSDFTESVTLVSAQSMSGLSDTHIGSYTIIVTPAQIAAINPALDVEEIDVVFTNTSGATRTFDIAVTATKVTKSSLQFGIYQFDGDTGSGTGTPVYATNVNVWIDTELPPTVSDFDKRLPITFGNGASPVEIDEMDITNLLNRDTNTLITRGIHRVWVKSISSGTNNVQGLGSIQFVPLLDIKQE